MVSLELGIGVRSIKVSEDTWEKLHKLKVFLSKGGKAKSFDDVIRYLLEVYEKVSGVERQ